MTPKEIERMCERGAARRNEADDRWCQKRNTTGKTPLEVAVSKLEVAMVRGSVRSVQIVRRRGEVGFRITLIAEKGQDIRKAGWIDWIGTLTR